MVPAINLRALRYTALKISSRISFIKLSCYLDGNTVDKRIFLPGISLQYCLKLPQSSNNSNTGDITALTTPGTTVKPIKIKVDVPTMYVYFFTIQFFF